MRLLKLIRRPFRARRLRRNRPPKALSLQDEAEAAWAEAEELDPDGFHLFRAAEAYTGINIYSAFPVEDSLGYFEAMSGHELLRWLEAETIGSYSLSRLPSGVEVACDLRVDQSGEKYRRHHEEICKLAVGKLLRME